MAIETFNVITADIDEVPHYIGVDNASGGYWYWTSNIFDAKRFNFDYDHKKNNDFKSQQWLITQAHTDIDLVTVSIVIEDHVEVIIPCMDNKKKEAFDEIQKLKKLLQEKEKQYSAL